MAWWPFGKKVDDRSVEALLEEANAASPTGAGVAATAPAGTPGDGSFRMTVEDVFSITNRGTVVTGRVESGTVRVGMAVDVVRDGGVAFTTEVTGVEMFRKVRDTATVGDHVGLLLEGLGKADLHQGDLVQG
ncbi:EF-Tu/IF-2/RF-3 family GTPase [Nocardioides halotolerans]|uniref:EF-Tu/IF-2/RF-3 family GTPase n=1 Tax=Nocardioides halotolerans TaxID=433660 RepID=UPI00040CD91E|nr:EF-Tu/IF-2/RF-3 family GTPase [Nocardioides halotolerans]